jgi:hypothetical protein
MAGPVPAATRARAAGATALLLSGFAGALRRSELVALQVEDVAVVANGLRLRIARGKTDQAGRGPRSAPHGAARGDLSGPCVQGLAGRRQARPGRCFERSAPEMALATPRYTPTPCG